MLKKGELRRFWISVHKYIGLTLGLLLVLLGLSGSVAVYWRELSDMGAAKPAASEVAKGWTSYDIIFNTLEEAQPDRNEYWEVMLPWSGEGGKGIIYAVYEEPEEKEGKYESPLYFGIDPFSGKESNTYYWGETVSSWIYNFHSYLQAGMFGSQVVGIFGFIFLTLALSGLYLWWPAVKGGKWLFTTSPKKGKARFEFELHKVVGFYSLIVVITLCISGLAIVYTKETAALLNAVQPMNAPVDGYGEEVLVENPGAERMLSWDEAVSRSHEMFPNSKLRGFTVPGAKQPNGAYGVVLRQPSEIFDNFYPETYVWFDPYTKDIISVTDPRDYNFTRSLIRKRYPFHGGEAFGAIGRFLVFLGGLIPALMYYTGIRQWLRMRARKAAATSTPT